MEDFNKQFYEAKSLWSDGAVQDAENLNRIAKTVDMIPSGVERLLDVGCGNGVFGHYLQTKRPEIKLCGVDRSSSAIENVRFDKRQSGIDELPFEDKTFDIVTCLQVIEHLQAGIYQKALEELSRISKKYIIIGVPFQEAIDQQITKCPSCRSTFNVHLHLRSFDLPILTSLFEDYGLHLDKICYPDIRVRKKYLHYLMKLKRVKTPLQSFNVPVCPVCGYSEGDKCQLSESRHLNDRSGNVTRSSSSIKSGLKAFVDPLWPVEEVPGYWIICRYTLSAGLR